MIVFIFAKGKTEKGPKIQHTKDPGNKGFQKGKTQKIQKSNKGRVKEGKIKTYSPRAEYPRK